MVILKSTALAGLPLNLGVDVGRALLSYFERHARRFSLIFPRMSNISLLSTYDFCVIERASGRRGAVRSKTTKSTRFLKKHLRWPVLQPSRQVGLPSLSMLKLPVCLAVLPRHFPEEQEKAGPLKT